MLTFNLIPTCRGPVVPVHGFLKFEVGMFFPEVEVVKQLRSILQRKHRILIVRQIVLYVISGRITVFPDDFFCSFLVHSVTIFQSADIAAGFICFAFFL